MSHPYRTLETGMETFARFCYRKPFFPLALVGLLVLGLGFAIPRLQVDTSVEGFMHPDDPARLAYNGFREQFGRDEILVVGAEGNGVFTASFLERLNRLHRDLEQEVPHLDEITSLINVRNTWGNGETLEVGDLMARWPETPEDLASLARRVRENRFYRNLLISEDETTAVLAVRLDTFAADAVTSGDGFVEPDGPGNITGAPPRFLTDREVTNAVSRILDLCRRHEAPDFQIRIAGSPAVNHAIKASMMRDARRFLKLAVLTAACLLFLIFRRIGGVILPLLVVSLSLVSTLGLMAATGGIIKLPTQILPSFLLAVGIGYAVHILALFYQDHDRTGNREGAVIHAVGHSGLALLLTGLTTAAGLASFATSSVAPIGDLGRYAAAGVLLSMTYTFLLLPPLLRFFSMKPARHIDGGRGKPSGFDALTAGIAHMVTRHPLPVLAVALILFAAAIPGLMKLRFSHNPLEWLPARHPVRTGSTELDTRLRGTVNLEILIDSGEKNGLYNPDLLRRMDALAASLETTAWPGLFVGKTWSLTTILKETHKALNANDDRAYVLPDSRALTAQELLLFESSGSDDLEDFVDRDYRIARLTLKVPYRDAVAYSRFLATLNHKLATELPDVRITVTGMAALFFTTIRNAIDSMALSYGIAFASITLIMMLLLGVRMGLLSMIPNLMPVLITMGIMGAAGIPLNLFTMLVGNIAIGLAVDDTLHLFHNVRRARAASGDMASAITGTLHTTGRAMLVTSLVLASAFYLYVFAEMNNLFHFGLLTGTAILLALLFDFLVSPAMLMVLDRRFPLAAAEALPVPPQNTEVMP